LVADISRFTMLEPGDLIATGTPGGVGHGMEPPSYLRDGDVVEVTIDGIGTLRNRFVQA
jgi:acylpyruvate hydrolase